LHLHFIETAVFTRRIVGLGLEDELRQLQSELLANPAAGDTDAGTGGLRKVRMPVLGRNAGKRGGARVHYLYLAGHGVIYFLFVYGKKEQETLTPQQKKQLKAVAESIKKEWDGRA